MVFSSHIFLFYFLPLFFLTYISVPERFKNPLTLLFSLVFYSWGAPKFVVLVVTSALIDYYIAQSLVRDRRNSRFLVSVGVVLNVVMLATFKYLNFFVENLNYILLEFGFENISWTAIALPIGISFLTFQKISYLLDVYRRSCEPQENFFNYLLFVVLFPQLIAGPIVRYKDIANQITHRSAFENIDERFVGIFRFTVGLAKKVLVANVLAEQVDTMFAADNLHNLGTYSVWMGMIAYSFQIYFDFAGYSDMAIGLGKMIGFTFPENFNFPYISRNITEFWRRWHMTLSNWMRDYLYIPLGGNRISGYRTFVNLWTVFLISGIWHGASWNFVLWGAFHGAILILDRLFLIRLTSKLPVIFQTVLTYFLTLMGWVLFRFEEVSEFRMIYHRMFSWHPDVVPIEFSSKFYFIIAIAAVFSFMGRKNTIENRANRLFHSSVSSGLNLVKGVCLLLLLFLSISELTVAGYNPFIYFQF